MSPTRPRGHEPARDRRRREPAAGPDPGRPAGALTLGVTLPAEPRRPARLVVGGVLDRDGLALLVHLAHAGMRRGRHELVLDVRGLTDFPSALFAALLTLADDAGRRRCLLRLDGLDAAVAAVGRGAPARPGGA